MNERFSADLHANGYPSVLRKKHWILYLIRKEQSSTTTFSCRFWALIKKTLLIGTGSELPASAFDGEGLRIPHLNGIIINNAARIGSNCTLFHQTTIGSASVSEKVGSPCIGDNVLIGAGAKVLGPIRIGNGARIGANAVVTKDVPANATVVGSNRIISGRNPK